MTMPLMKPRRKNPVLRTRQMNLPPFARGRTALGMTAAAAAVIPSAVRPRAHGGRFICRVRSTGFLRRGFIKGMVMARPHPPPFRGSRRRCRGTGHR